jgi:ABC-type Fe3+-hydroxamate transport system substrate-binding protein
VWVEDSRGKALLFESAPRRIVCLVPSITETLFALGAGERVVGVTEFCIHPRGEVASRPKVGGTKNPDLSRVLELRPDLVIANQEENRRRDVDRLEASGVPVLVTYARDLDSALREIELAGRLLGAEEVAADLVGGIRQAQVEAHARIREPKPRVVALVWKRPYMAINADTFAHDLLSQCGVRNPFADRERRYPRVTETEIERAQPDVILLPTEPYAFGEQDREELSRLRCPAAENGRIHIVEGELLSWYGPRMGRALRAFSELLYP